MKNFEHKFCMYISTGYVRTTKFRGKSIFVVLWVKKTKKYLVQNLILSSNFVFFT
jgi:hypothetical protein